MQASRILELNDQSFNGKSVAYIMHRDQRAADNHALVAAQEMALEHKVPLHVIFPLQYFKHRAREHYTFMLDGLQEVADSLNEKDISFTLIDNSDQDHLPELIEKHTIGALFFDFTPLKNFRNYTKQTAKNHSIYVAVVDTHNVIPVWVASDKQEYAAHTMRRKVHKYLEHYIKEPDELRKHPHASPKTMTGISFAEARKRAQALPENGTRISFTAGETAATQRLTDFIEKGLDTYALHRNNPTKQALSDLSPYLHFGQLSSLRVALEVIKMTDIRPLLFEEARLIPASTEPSDLDGMNALLEEMIVRKELSDNFCLHNEHYLDIKGGPAWGQKTLDEHADDPRDFVYTRDEWEQAKTHDDSWNAAQQQLLKTGKIHGYIRMYWAKKMLEWSATPQQALKDCIYLNDKYSLDGNDPNGYVGILWSMTGLHDRPWQQRSVFGQVRYMNEGGLKRKFDIKQYQEEWL